MPAQPTAEVTVAPVTRDNWEQVIQLRVPEAQRSFVAPNLYSIAQAQFLTHAAPRVICAAGTPVGFVLTAFDEDDRQYWVYRLMIDEAHQRRGYARRAMQHVIEQMQAQPNVTQLALGYKPGNEAAAALYRSLGFQESGEVIGGEVIVRLHF